MKVLNANWVPDPAGGDGRFEAMIITKDGERHSFAVSPAAMTALVALAQAEPLLLWDPVNQTLIAANVIGQMPWTIRTDHD